ncbi:hypothetical protein ASD37_18090 [Mycobacterium sp. Root135]|uniref:hypothetical protein n=1 Tax=Mycobacterium sp. Root135 TaxID=1736457 RepID=UPI0006F827CB|nr:hypothetical protein [Mycobacterium sp. Root135]KQY06217.1 hypothetical protein ASD37_18090 [Mycobacterium sp. Root135]
MISSCPYLIALALSPLFQVSISWLDRITGSGQLLLTSIALLGGGLKELGGMEPGVRESHKDHITPFSFVFAGLMAAAYGAIAATQASGKTLTPDVQRYVTLGSMVFFAVSLILTGYAVAVSHPRESL